MSVTRKNAAQFIPLIQAIAAGKTIQIDVDQNGKWKDHEPHYGFSFNLKLEQYRIKPQPQKILLVRHGDNEKWRTACITGHKEGYKDADDHIESYKTQYYSRDTTAQFKVIEIPEDNS